MVKEELREKLAEVRRASHRVMTVVACFRRGCARVDLWGCSTKWKKF